MSWRIAEAKQRFSEVLRRASEEPQLILNRDRLVGAVVGPDDAHALLALRNRSSSSLADALEEGQRIFREQGYTLDIPARVDRPNPILRVADAGRHQRRK
jgi:antitoxin (DNA-binding transcriptional repressor) of toxin-antitoxin stability system